MADKSMTLEEALESTQRSVAEVVTRAGKLAAAGKKAAKAAEHGDLRTLRQVLANLVDIADRAGEATVKASGGWAFSGDEDEEAYFSDGRFEKELLAAAQKAKVGLYPVDGVLACFPLLVRVNAKDRTVAIDRKPFRFVRPTYLLDHLKAVQNRPGSTNPGPFLDSLYRSYQLSLAGKKGDSRVTSLRELYKILTLLPTVKKEYSQQEFARDLYLLEESGTTETGSGATIRFHASTGTKGAGQVLRVVDRNGGERLYYAVEFVETR